jgi:hypothetical protein
MLIFVILITTIYIFVGGLWSVLQYRELEAAMHRRYLANILNNRREILSREELVARLRETLEAEDVD